MTDDREPLTQERYIRIHDLASAAPRPMPASRLVEIRRDVAPRFGTVAELVTEVDRLAARVAELERATIPIIRRLGSSKATQNVRDAGRAATEDVE